MSNSKNTKISIIGLGYVGLPLAVEFSKKYSTLGFDINKTRIDELNEGFDRTNELSKNELSIIDYNQLKYTTDQDELADSNVYIITVPTPITEDKQPDLHPVESASKLVGR